MTARNSDDAIASLMQEMGQQRGYDQNDQYDTTVVHQATKINNANDNTSTTTTTTDNDGDRQLLLRQQQQQQQLLIPELVDYPNNQFMAGSQSIWNPLVMSSDSGGSDNGSGNEYEYGYLGLILPTNPQIEIIRRRVYEKFRNEVTIFLQDIEHKLLPSSLIGGGGSGSFSKNKNKLPIPSMLDRWHMDSKLEEWNILKQEQQQEKQKHDDLLSGSSSSTSNRMTTTTTTTSTVDILRELTRRKQQQDGSVYDPILLNKQSPTIFVDSILKPNVEKLWEQYHYHNGSGGSTNNNKGSNNLNLPPKFNKKSKQIHKGLYRLVCEANDSFEIQLHQVVRQESSSSSSSTTNNKNKKNNNRLPKISLSSSTDEGGGGGGGGDSSSTLVRVTYSGVTLKLHSAYLEKLQRLYDRTQQRRHQQQHQQQQQVGLSFEEALFCLLCRYDMIQGAGLQAGVPGSIMDVLLKQFNCKKECFASPFNCRYETFSSAFYDIDFYFGSQGSFFELELELEVTPPPVAAVAAAAAAVTKNEEEEGICYQANPPFCEGLILQLNNKITDILLSSQQQQQQRPIMFVVFVPAWHESICYQALLSSKYLTQHLLLKQGQHWYAEGTQHRRKDSFRVASFDTSILFYQNEAAKRLWNLQKTNQKQKVSSSSITCSTDDNNKNNNSNGDADDDILPLGNAILDELKNAFCQDPGSMQKEEQQQQQETSRINKPRRSNFVTTKTKATTSISPSNVVTSSTHDDKPSGNTTPSSSFSVVQRKRNKKATKLSPAKKERKRKWNQQEEGKAQLNLLESLGLSSSAATTATTTKSSQAGSRTVSAEDNNNSSKRMNKLRPGGKANNKEKLLSRKMKKKRPHR